MKEKRQAERMCIVCKTMRGKNELIRVVKSPEGEIALDPTGKARGRGAYICKDGTCMNAAAKARALHKAFKTNVEQAVYGQLKAETDADTKDA